MRILQLHANSIEYKPIKREVKLAEECDEEEHRLEELVVLFTCVEEGDNEAVAKKAVEEIKGALGKLKANKILIYPYAHLSNNLAKPADALNVIKAMEKNAREAGVETHRTPFGWCKSFSISIKGHPLAEQFRIILSKDTEGAETVSEALVAEETMKSSWFIMRPDGEMTPVEDFDFTNHPTLEKFAKHEIEKRRTVQETPPHVNLMKRLELVDYEANSDSGNFRWYPKGRLIKSLLEDYVTQKVIEYGAMEVETPIMYGFEHPSVADYLNRFPARQYILKSGEKDFFLRFSACFGQFLMLHDTQISYRQLPLKIYELTKYSFRREKSGELSGLRRLRAFTMPDCHALCADLEQAKKEFLIRFMMCKEIMGEGLELEKQDYELALRFTMDFYQKNKQFFKSLAKMNGKPTLIEIWDQRFFYFITKWEFNFVDNMDKASALSTDQIDIENAKRYNITYVDEHGQKEHPIILHCSPSGAVERCVYAILEKAFREQQKGGKPILPFWLAPIQVRVIPMADGFLEHAERIADEIAQHGMRADLDDRPLTMQKKVREAETEWINYIIVVGQKEIDSSILPIRDRKLGRIRKMKLQEFVTEMNGKIRGKPFKPLPLSKFVSKRPRFFG
jgi:threonyl-tRNA synthetase